MRWLVYDWKRMWKERSWHNTRRHPGKCNVVVFKTRGNLRRAGYWVETQTSRIWSRNLRIQGYRVETRTSRIWSRNLRIPCYRVETRTSEYGAGTSGYRLTESRLEPPNMEQEPKRDSRNNDDHQVCHNHLNKQIVINWSTK